MTTATQELTVGSEVVITRVFDAPRTLLFKLWIDSIHMANWWGPACFTNPVCEMDVRPGGAIRIDMKGPDGTVYPMGGTFHEIVEPERLVFTSTAFFDESGQPKLENHNTVTFEDQGGKTLLTVKAVIKRFSPEVAGALAGMRQGWTQSLIRLGELAAGEGKTADREIRLVRTFDAPPALVWQAWTDPKHLSQWWGPNGFTTTTSRFEFEPGGVWRFVMHGPDGRDYENKITFLEVHAPKLIVFKHGGGDEDLEPVNHTTTARFEERDGKTLLTFWMVFVSTKARDFVAENYGAVEGGKQTLGRLAEYVKTLA